MNIIKPPYSTDFARLRKTLFNEKADRVPLMELGIDEGLMGQFIGRPICTLQDIIDFYRTAGYDYVKLSPIIDMNPGKIAPENGFRESEATHLDRSRKWGTEGKGVICNWDEFNQFQWAKIGDEQFRFFEEAERILPGDMKIIGQYGDIFTFTWEFMGFETFSFALVEDETLVEAVFNKIGSIVYTLFERMAQFGIVGGLFYSDDIAYCSGLLVSPQVLKKYLFPWMRKIGDLCKERRIPYIYHSDGKMWDVLEDLIELGIHALQPVEPKAWDIREVKEKYGDRLCLIGNVDVDLLSRGRPEVIRETVRELILTVGVKGGYCVGSGNTVPNYVPLPNYRAMVQATWDFGSH